MPKVHALTFVRVQICSLNFCLFEKVFVFIILFFWLFLSLFDYSLSILLGCKFWLLLLDLSSFLICDFNAVFHTILLILYFSFQLIFFLISLETSLSHVSHRRVLINYERELDIFCGFLIS